MVGMSITGANADNWLVCACDTVAIVTDILITAPYSANLQRVQTDVRTIISTGKLSHYALLPVGGGTQK